MDSFGIFPVCPIHMHNIPLWFRTSKSHWTSVANAAQLRLCRPSITLIGEGGEGRGRGGREGGKEGAQRRETFSLGLFHPVHGCSHQ